MQSLGAMAHFDYRMPGSYSYEQAVRVTRRLGLPRADVEQLVLRAFLNVVGRNCDNHVKNIAFLMDRSGGWSLAPAFDVIYAFNPAGKWIDRHQMTINGKRDGFKRADLIALATVAGIKTPWANRMLDRVISSVRRRPEFAESTGVSARRIESIRRGLLVGL